MNGGQRGVGKPLDERVVAFVYGELSPADNAAFRQELSHRPDLQAQVDQLLALGRHLDNVPVPEPPPEVVADIMAYAASRHRVVAAEKGRERRLTLADLLRWLTTPQVGLAMAAVLVIAVGVYMGQSARRPTEPGSAQEVKETMRPTRTVTAAKAKEAAAKDNAKGEATAEAPEPVATMLEEQLEVPAATPNSELPRAVASRPTEPVPGTPAQDLDLPTKPLQAPVAGANLDSEVAAADETTVVSSAATEESEALAGQNDVAREQAAQDLGKVAVRTLVDGLERGVRRDSGTKKAPAKNMSQPKSALLQEEKERQKDQVPESESMARQAAPEDPAMRSAQRNEMIASGSGVADSEGLDAPSQDLGQLKKVGKRDEQSFKNARGAKETVTGESSKWLGNTYDLGEGEAETDGEAVAEEVPVRAQMSDQAPMDSSEMSGDAAKPAAPSPVVDEQRAVARTMVDEAWGVVPSSTVGQPGAINRGGASDTAVVQSSKKGKLAVDFGDDNMADKVVSAPRESSGSANKPQEAPAMAPTKGVLAAQLEEGSNGGGADTAYQQKVAEVEAVDGGGADEKSPKEKTKSLDDSVMFEAAVKQEKGNEVAQCDQYWVEMMDFEKAGQADKALKLLALFKIGICQGTRSQDDIALHEARLYIASGKRAKARKVLEKLQKIPAMEEKAIDMMEAMEDDGLSQ